MSFILTTERLQLRPLAADDLDAFHRLCAQPGVRRYLFDDDIISRDVAAEIVQTSAAYFADNGYGLWAMRRRDGVTVEEKGEEEIRGACGFWFFHEPPEFELLYLLSEDYWGQGLAVEAARAVMNYGFEKLGFDRIQASTDAPNSASIRVMEKLGMSFLRRRAADSADALDTIFYAVTSQAFAAPSP